MMGMNVELAFPEVRLVAPQPPLRGQTLRAGLEAYAADLIPGLRFASDLNAEPTVTFVIGNAPNDDANAIRVCGDDWSCRVGTESSVERRALIGTWPIGALAAAGAAAPEALRLILPRMAANLGLELPTKTFNFAMRSVALDLALPGLTTGPIDLGPVDFISGGAITTNALYALLRIPGLAGKFRVIEPDVLDLSNLNRYSLALRSLLGEAKAEVLAGYTSDAIAIGSCLCRFDEKHRSEIGHLASRVCVGVDDIPSRWAVQREWPTWLCVGATSHLEVRLSAHIAPGPCAGCAHPEDEELVGEIPTISFVSYWAGLLQARELLAAAADLSPTAPIYWCSPFGLANDYGLAPWGLAPRRNCPVACPASSEAHDER
jgi:hypothetical protein